MLRSGLQKHYVKGSPERKGLEAALKGFKQTREVPAIVNGKELEVR